MRRHLVTKSTLPSCCWKRHCVLFLQVRCVTVDDEQYFTGGCFFFSFFSLSYYEKCMIVLFVFAISISVLIFFILILIIFIKIFVCFQFSLLITISHMLFFFISVLILLIFIFFLGYFVKVLLAFNFILRSKLMFFFI